MTPPCALQQRNAGPVDRSLFHMLHPEGRRLITRWAERGSGVPDSADASDYFEGFIYLWFAVNGWGACVTGTDRDREWVDAVAGDEEIARPFADLLHADDRFDAIARRFADLWPIFKSSEIRRRAIRVPESYTRPHRVQVYLEHGIPFEPSCWRDHRGDDPPLDWTHTFQALYRVRCNLFHGEKTLDSENDRQIVAAAYPVLMQIVQLLELVA